MASIKRQKKIIVIASENVFSSSFVKVVKIFTPEQVVFSPFNKISQQADIIEKTENLIITLIIDQNDKENVDRLQSKMSSLPAFIHCCLIKDMVFLFGEVLPIPVDLDVLLKKISSKLLRSATNISKQLLVEHNRKSLLEAVTTFKHNSVNRIGAFKSFVGYNPTKNDVLEALKIYFDPDSQEGNISDNLINDFIECKKTFSAFSLTLNDIAPCMEDKIETALHKIKNFSKSIKKGENLSSLIEKSMDLLINILAGLQRQLKNMEKNNNVDQRR